MEQRKQPSIGRIVRYVSWGQDGIAPALITHVYPDHPEFAVDLTAFYRKPDAMQPTAALAGAIALHQTVPFDADKKLGTWHWPDTNGDS